MINQVKRDECGLSKTERGYLWITVFKDSVNYTLFSFFAYYSIRATIYSNAIGAKNE